MLYLFVEASNSLMKCMVLDMKAYGIEGLETWQKWFFDLFDDMDIVTFIYSVRCLTCSNTTLIIGQKNNSIQNKSKE